MHFGEVQCNRVHKQCNFFGCGADAVLKCLYVVLCGAVQCNVVHFAIGIQLVMVLCGALRCIVVHFVSDEVQLGFNFFEEVVFLWFQLIEKCPERHVNKYNQFTAVSYSEKLRSDDCRIVHIVT